MRPIDREKVIMGLGEILVYCHEQFGENDHDVQAQLTRMNQTAKDAIDLLKAQEARHRLEVHNIGNVDIPEGVTWEQFQAVMSGVVAALEHTDRGESWPYEEGKSDV